MENTRPWYFRESHESEREREYTQGKSKANWCIQNASATLKLSLWCCSWSIPGIEHCHPGWASQSLPEHCKTLTSKRLTTNLSPSQALPFSLCAETLSPEKTIFLCISQLKTRKRATGRRRPELNLTRIRGLPWHAGSEALAVILLSWLLAVPRNLSQSAIEWQKLRQAKIESS